MDVFEQRFYKFNYRLLYFLGLWPYTKSRIRRVYIVNILIWTFNITQICATFTFRDNFDIMAEVIPTIVTAINVTIKYHTYNMGILNMKKLLDDMITDWEMWKYSKLEHEIMVKFAEMARMYTVIYTSVIYFAMATFLVTALLPSILNIVVPLNESRPLEMAIVAEYFVDQQQYFYPINAHIVVTVTLSITILVAADTQLVVFSCHVCGIFAIVGFRLEHYLKNNVTLDEMSAPQREECFKHVTLSIKTHKRAIEFANRLESSFSYSLLVQCGFNVVCMSISLYQIVMLLGKSAQVVKFISFVFAQLFHLFCASYSGQQIIDHSSEIYSKAYNGFWYEIPIKVRKLLVLVMRRSLAPSQLTAGKLFVFCLESFSTIIQTSTSYFMVLSSVQ